MDFHSNGEWNESWLIRKSIYCGLYLVVKMVGFLLTITSLIIFEIQKGDYPVCYEVDSYLQLYYWVLFFGTRAQSVWWCSQKFHYWWETFSVQVPWGKDEKNFGEGVKQYANMLAVSVLIYNRYYFDSWWQFKTYTLCLDVIERFSSQSEVYKYVCSYFDLTRLETRTKESSMVASFRKLKFLSRR